MKTTFSKSFLKENICLRSIKMRIIINYVEEGGGGGVPQKKEIAETRLRSVKLL